jgi:hypothetical protein
VEAVIAHQIESEVAGPPPRRNAHLPWGTQALLALAGALAVLLFLGGARALEEAGRLAWVGLWGRPATARVVSFEMSPKSIDHPSQPLGFQYAYHDPFTGRLVQAHAILEQEPDPSGDPALGTGVPEKPAPLPRLFVGQQVALRVAGGPAHEIVDFWSPAPWGKGVFLALCGLVVMGVGVRLTWALVHWRHVRVHLLQSGQAVIGTVIHKRTDVQDAPHYYLRYGYITAGAGEICEHEERVSQEQWQRFEIGEPVTVLYDPGQPAKCGLYALMKHA